jgi:hypothetical protein
LRQRLALAVQQRLTLLLRPALVCILPQAEVLPVERPCPTLAISDWIPLRTWVSAVVKRRLDFNARFKA